jgi:hypothetical protein
MCSLCSDESQASLKRAIAIEISVSLPHERIQFTKSQLLEEGGHFKCKSNKHGYLHFYIHRRSVGDFEGKVVEVDLDPNTLLLGHTIIELTTNKICSLSGGNSIQYNIRN